MAFYRTDEDYDLVIAVFERRDQAEEFYTVMRSHEGRGAVAISVASARP